MNFLLDLFTNWTFDKVMDYMLAAVIWFYSSPSQSRMSIPMTLMKEGVIEINIPFCDRYRYVCFFDDDLSLYVQLKTIFYSISYF